jgi:hypothetical protein
MLRLGERTGQDLEVGIFLLPSLVALPGITAMMISDVYYYYGEWPR